MSLGCDPRSVLRTLLPDEADSDIPDDLDDMTLWRLIISLVSAPPRRHRLAHMSTLDDVVRLLQTCTKIIVLTGAGVRIVSWQLCTSCCVGLLVECSHV
jgi:NAD-dependent deacetylase sirtuin 1